MKYLKYKFMQTQNLRKIEDGIQKNVLAQDEKETLNGTLICNDYEWI